MTTHKDKKHKAVNMLVSVRVPVGMTAKQARAEVRSLINDQCNHKADEGDVRTVRVTPVPDPGKAGYRVPYRSRDNYCEQE